MVTAMEDDIERVLVDEQVIHKRLDVMALEIRKDFPLGRNWIVTPRFAAGVYHDGSGVDLGNELEFREGIVLTWIGQRLRLGVGFYHASNGGLGDNNPGTEVLEAVLSFPVGATYD